MFKEIKNIILKDKERSNYYEENVGALAKYGYETTYLDEEVLNVLRWETETIYYYKVVEKDSGKKIYIGVVDTRGNTEMQENQGITEIYEVKPIQVMTTKWEII